MVEIPYEVAHNLIYGSIEFAGEAGIEPVDEWGITQYILEEDDDNVPLIEYQWGLNGMALSACRRQVGGILLSFYHAGTFCMVARRRWSSLLPSFARARGWKVLGLRER